MFLLIKAVVMAGGEGTRLWPKSTSQHPKQFSPLIHGKSLFQCTIDRLRTFLNIEDIFVVTQRKYEKYVIDQAPHIPEGNRIIEPMGRDTAACIGLSAIYLEKKFSDPVLLTVPADHYVINGEDFERAIGEGATKAALEKCVVTLGIKPSRPETGYGYIKRGERDGSLFRVEHFVEKPHLPLAQKYEKDPSYFWNSGIFIWRASTVLEMIKEYMAPLYHSLAILREALDSPSYETKIEQEYNKLEKISIDYGVIEQVHSIYVLPVEFLWDDVGSWDSLGRILSSDENGNVIEGNFTGIETKNCIIHSTDLPVATIGVENLVIVATPGGILVCPKHKAQEVKRLFQN